ncbi:Hypp3434 [Branchiostoma lanceolatum]|uniref:N-acyl-aliphatic-L-amino acid amidohydrolase n=1 Tax=Branchiostoma lanceolatum TaxID=7740 RepID=A0A8K0EXW0_BRALA|nr:Hypp3434 [Branchiostoma lanceolatum]
MRPRAVRRCTVRSGDAPCGQEMHRAVRRCTVRSGDAPCGQEMRPCGQELDRAGRSCTYAGARGFTPTVIWTDCDYCGPPGHGRNYWTWYFEAVNKGIEQGAQTWVCIAPPGSFSEVRSVFLARSGAGGDLVDFRFADMEHKATKYFQPITAEIRALVNHVISGYIKPAARVENIVNAFYKSFMADTVNIGVHMRLKRDHIEEMENEFGQKTPDVQDFVRVVRHLITNDAAAAAVHAGKEIRIFLACDLDEGLAVFKAEFGDDKVLNIEALRGDDFLNVQREDPDTARSLGDEVFTDILLLSRCDYLVHDESSVAALAYYFNPNVKTYFVSGDASDRRRLNAQPRFDSEELLRQAVARETSNIRDLSDAQNSLWTRFSRKWQLLWMLFNFDPDVETLASCASCFHNNRKQSKCSVEFGRLYN